MILLFILMSLAPPVETEVKPDIRSLLPGDFMIMEEVQRDNERRLMDDYQDQRQIKV